MNLITYTFSFSCLNTDKIKHGEILQDVTNRYNYLQSWAPNDYVKEEIKARVIYKGQTFYQFALDKKIKKLNFLSLKQKSAAAIQVLNTPTESTNDHINDDEAEVETENNVNEQSHRKRKRKFIPKNQYKKIKNLTRCRDKRR